jgi:hypothetical protein
MIIITIAITIMIIIVIVIIIIIIVNQWWFQIGDGELPIREPRVKVIAPTSTALVVDHLSADSLHSASRDSVPSSSEHVPHA